jgi:hypothetical protein
MDSTSSSPIERHSAAKSIVDAFGVVCAAASLAVVPLRRPAEQPD